jgi:hypothetical protein
MGPLRHETSASRAGLQEHHDCCAQDPQISTALQKPDQAATEDAAGGRLPNAPSTLALMFERRLVVWRNDRNAVPILGTTGRGTVPCWRNGPL